MVEDGIDGVVIGVDHDGAPPPEVDVLLPPVRDVVVRPEPLEPEVSLQFGTQAHLKLLGQ